MSQRVRVLDASPAQVWSILCDGWLYPIFVVGASRMREVDDGWPAVGSRLHHSVGSWPLIIDDVTEVLEVEPPRLLRLRARAWPVGSAEILIRLEAHSARTTVTIEEDVVSGPGLLLPKPVRDLQLNWRNTEVLRRLAFLAERRGG